MSIAYTSHMIDIFYNPIYFFNDPISYFEICITIDFFVWSKAHEWGLECLISELSTYSVLFNKLTLYISADISYQGIVHHIIRSTSDIVQCYIFVSF